MPLHASSAFRLCVTGSRNGLPETTHEVSVCMVEAGEVGLAIGPDLASFWRSACKPFQLVTSLACLPPDQVAALSEPDLAIGAASHSGQPDHVSRVSSLLDQLCFTKEQLQCGAHAPMHEPSARNVSEYQTLHSNCSGKHTFMLAACGQQAWPLDYRSPEHPLQVRNRAYLDRAAQVTHGIGVDGCSIPTFHGPLVGQARAWGKLATAMAEGSGLGSVDEDARLARVGWAMHHQPFWMSGDDRLDKAVVEGASEALTVKIGAEGLFCIARPGARQGVALKVHSGVTECLGAAVRVVLHELGVSIQGVLPGERVTSVRGAVVGERRAAFT